MREIKFNVWDVTNKRMFRNAFKLTNEGTSTWNQFTNDSSENLIWLQFSGLKDKNKTEIYDGDKVSDGKIIYKVEWNQQNTQFCLNPLYEIGKIDDISLLLVMNYQPLGNGYLSRKDLEVVGNIHEKP